MGPRFVVPHVGWRTDPRQAKRSSRTAPSPDEQFTFRIISREEA
jgi:hypothetical protein